MPPTPHLILFRIKTDHTPQFVDAYFNNASIRQIISEQYLFDSPEGEVYFLFNRDTNQIVSTWRVQSAKALVEVK